MTTITFSGKTVDIKAEDVTAIHTRNGGLSFHMRGGNTVGVKTNSDYTPSLNSILSDFEQTVGASRLSSIDIVSETHIPSTGLNKDGKAVPAICKFKKRTDGLTALNFGI